MADEQGAIPEGMKAWHGGDAAPADWAGAGSRTIGRLGQDLNPGIGPIYWRWATGDDRSDPDLDIIAYTPTPTAGTSAHPICGKDTPHYHSPAEVEQHRETEAWVEKSWQEPRPQFFPDTPPASTSTAIAAGKTRCGASPDHADILETIANASADWQKRGYASALAEVRDMANVGRALMEALPGGYSYMNCPSEIVSDLQNDLADALAAAPKAASEDRATGLLREALRPLAFEGVTIPRGVDRDMIWFTDGVTGRSITVGHVLDARAALAASPTDATGAEVMLEQAVTHLVNVLAADGGPRGNAAFRAAREWWTAYDRGNLPVAGETL